MNKYYITGVPGIGKTTVMQVLKQRGFAAFDVDYIPGLCGWVNRVTKDPVEFLHGASEEWHKAHAWECNVSKLQETIENSMADRLFVFGITDNQKEYLGFFDTVFLLHADVETFMQRMAGRDEEHFGHHEDDRKTVLTWYKEFEGSLRKYGAIPIDASKPIEEIAGQILATAI